MRVSGIAFISLTALASAGMVTAVAQPDPKATISPTGGTARQIEQLIEPQARAGLFSGVILVQRGDRVVFQRAYGFASWELSVANGDRTLFGIASITKPMSQAVASLLVAQRRLDLRAAVEQYIPGFPRGPGGGKPTIEQLLKHTAGVPHRVTTAAEETLPLYPADIVERVKARGLLFEPGSKELYSSAGYTCLARVIEIVEGRSFDDALREDIFKPAQMRYATSETGPRLMAGRALPYVLRAGKDGPVVEAAPYKDLRFLAGAGSVYATPLDLVAFATKVRGGAFGAELEGFSNGGEKDQWRGWYGRTHAYEASVDLLPSQHLVLVMVSNLQSAANWQLRRGIRNLLAGRSVRALPMPPPRGADFEPASELVGLYGDPNDPVEIALKDGQLHRDENQIYPVAGDKYYIPASGATTWFRRQDGRVDSVVLTFDGGAERVLRRVP